MPLVSTIRKQILTAVVEEIIPLLESVVVTQVSAEPPFYLHKASHRTIRDLPLPDKEEAPFDLLTHWTEDYVLAKKMPHLGFLYEGANDERWGITNTTAKALKARGEPVPPGMTSVRLVAPCAFYIPAGIPRTDGKYLLRDADLDQYGSPSKLSIDFTTKELFVYLYSQKTGATHHLHIANRQLPQQLRQYAVLVKAGQLAQAQHLLLEMMTTLAQLLQSRFVQLSNSSWPSLHESSIMLSDTITEANFRICYDAIQYIQLHLNTSLTREKIAQAIRVSPIHLNRVFKRETNLTIMNFVTQYRLNAARQILSKGTERVGEIASLVGFASLHSMSVVFKRAYGMSPTAYRKRMSAAQSFDEKSTAAKTSPFA